MNFQASMIDCLSALPDEVTFTILDLCSLGERLAIRQVCKRLHALLPKNLKVVAPRETNRLLGIAERLDEVFQAKINTQLPILRDIIKELEAGCLIPWHAAVLVGIQDAYPETHIREADRCIFAGTPGRHFVTARTLQLRKAHGEIRSKCSPPSHSVTTRSMASKRQP